MPGIFCDLAEHRLQGFEIRLYSALESEFKSFQAALLKLQNKSFLEFDSIVLEQFKMLFFLPPPIQLDEEYDQGQIPL